MTTLDIMIELNMEIAFRRYFEIVQKGLNLLPGIGSEKNGIGADGGQFFILKDHLGAPKFSFMLANDSQGRPYSYADGTKVIAHEIVDREATFNELYEYLPEALAMSAICTAGLVHQFAQ